MLNVGWLDPMMAVNNPVIGPYFFAMEKAFPHMHSTAPTLQPGPMVAFF